MAAAVVDGFAGYEAFAGPGWTPPAYETELERLRELLGRPWAWSLLAVDDGEIAGQITFLSAAEHAVHPDADAGLAHLRHLFVDASHWGTGLAVALHAAAVTEARERGFEQMRLFTPARHTRARGFYEREGWRAARPEFEEPLLGLALVEYRLSLDPV